MKISKIVKAHVHCEVVDVATMGELALLITMSDWAPGVFKDSYRNLNNFISTDIIALDVDEGCTLEEAKEKFKDYAHIIATTRNHQKEKHGKTCDRFRVILQLEEQINSSRVYTATYLALGLRFPFIDLACADASRQFFKSPMVQYVQPSGLQISPDNKGAVAKSTIEFLSKGAEQGKWNAAIFKASKDLQQQGYSQEESVQLLTRPTGHLDSRDLSTIDSAFKKENKYLKRAPESASEVQLWVGEWIVRRGLNINYNEQITIEGKGYNYSQIEDRLLLDTAAEGFKFGEKLLFAALRVYYDDAVERLVQQIKSTLTYQPGPDLAGSLITMWEGKENDLSAAVLKHFIWSVKRKMADFRVENHLMPILTGATGGGKTRAIEALLKPLHTLTTNKFLSIVNDEKQLFNFHKYFVVVFDEMSGANRTDVECLKNIITSESISYRMMRQNKNSQASNRSTFIGSTNKDVKAIINDPTSARRYYQIEFKKRDNWDDINNFDYTALWRSVDENMPSPIIPFLSQLGVKQEEFRQVSLIEEWLQLECDVGGEHWTDGPDALREFLNWLKTNSLKSFYRPQRFYKELADLVAKRRKAQMQYNLKPKSSYSALNIS